MTIAVALPLSRFYDREARHPNKRYLVQPMADGKLQSLSWSDVSDQARRAAHWLRRFGLPQGSTIAILSENCAHWIVADLAIWMAGHVSVPLSVSMTARSIAQILDHSDAALLFVGKLDDWPAIHNALNSDLPTIALPSCPADVQLEFIWADLQAWTPIQDNPQRLADQLATIIYTSSDTASISSGVMHSFGALGFAATHGSSLLGLGEKDRLFSYLPLSHIAERMFIELASIYCGQTVFFAQSRDTVLDDLKQARPTALFGVPRVWSNLQAAAYRNTAAKRLDLLLKLPLINRYFARRVLRSLGLGAIRAAISGVAALPESLLLWYRRLGLEVLEVYGVTENCGYSHMRRAGQPESSGVGQPCPHVEVKIANNGEVLVRSGATMLGYFKDPLKTAEAFTQDGFLRTGDNGEQDAEGNLHILGRISCSPLINPCTG